jgi:hypothetical protein
MKKRALPLDHDMRLDNRIVPLENRMLQIKFEPKGTFSAQGIDNLLTRQCPRPLFRITRQYLSLATQK